MNLARVAGAAYVFAIVVGVWALFSTASWRPQAGMAAALSYVVVTGLLYRLFAPIDAPVSFAAMLVSLTGCAMSMSPAGWMRVNPLPMFGVYCLLLAWLVWRSTLPRVLAGVLAVAGVGWLTFASPGLGWQLRPFNFGAGILGETVLTLWLVVVGPRVARR